MIELATFREAYTSKELSNIGLMSSAHNATDTLTKRNGNTELWKLLPTAIVKSLIIKWVVQKYYSS